MVRRGCSSVCEAGRWRLMYFGVSRMGRCLECGCKTTAEVVAISAIL